MILFFFSQLDQSCLQTSFAIGFIDCSSSIFSLASFLVCLPIKTNQWTVEGEDVPMHHVFFLFCPPPVPLLTLPFHFCLAFPLQRLLRSPLPPSHYTPAEEAEGECGLCPWMYCPICISVTGELCRSGCAWAWLSSSSSFKIAETEVYFSAWCHNSLSYGQWKEKGNCHVICLTQATASS